MSMSLGPDLHLHCSSAVFQELERHHCLQSGKRESWCKSYKNEEKKEGGKEEEGGGKKKKRKWDEKKRFTGGGEVGRIRWSEEGKDYRKKSW